MQAPYCYAGGGGWMGLIYFFKYVTNINSIIKMSDSLISGIAVFLSMFLLRDSVVTGLIHCSDLYDQDYWNQEKEMKEQGEHPIGQPF
jgi:hypothetical protein